MDSPSYELIQTLGYVRSCGFLLVLLFVGVASMVAAARLKKVIGAWVFSVATFVFFLIELVSSIFEFAEIDYEIARWFYVLSSLGALVVTITMLIGVATLKPPPPGSQREEVRG